MKNLAAALLLVAAVESFGVYAPINLPRCQLTTTTPKRIVGTGTCWYQGATNRYISVRGRTTRTVYRGSPDTTSNAAFPTQVFKNTPGTPADRTCPDLPLFVRKEVRDMDPQEWADFTVALWAVRAAGGYDALTQIHNQWAVDGRIHNNNFFAAWHRGFTAALEHQLRRYVPKCAIPYWAWAVDSQSLRSSVVLSARYYGSVVSNGRSISCPTDGAFVSWPIRPSGSSSSRCLRRQYSQSQGVAPTEEINRILNIGSWTSFAPALEMAHNFLHVAVGGDMTSFESPHDPTFWAHHGFIDYLWYLWQKKNSETMTNVLYSNNNSQAPRTLDTVMQPTSWGLTIRDTLDVENLCFTYADPIIRKDFIDGLNLRKRSVDPSIVLDPQLEAGVSIAAEDGGKDVYVEDVPDKDEAELPKADNYQDLTGLRSLSYLPDAFLKMRRISKAKATKYTDDLNSLIRTVNLIPGYISPSSLWYREELFAEAISEHDHFYINIGSKRLVINVNKNLSGYDAVKDIKAKCHAALKVNHISAPSHSYHDQLKETIGEPTNFCRLVDPFQPNPADYDKTD